MGLTILFSILYSVITLFFHSLHSFMNKEFVNKTYKSKTKYVKIVHDSKLFSLSLIDNTTLSIDEEHQILDAEEKGLQFVKNKLIFSL